MTTSPILGCLLAGLMLFPASLPAREGPQTRSMVMSRDGIVATEHPVASQIGATILAQGGNAVDAAVAANAALGLFAPMANGIGGDLFAIVYHARSDRFFGLNASGWSPAALTPEYLKSHGFAEIPRKGIHSVTVPGAVDGWAKLLKRFGRLSLAQVLEPSIRLADQGFPVTEIFSSYWVASEKLLGSNAIASATFLVRGKAPQPGAVVWNPDLAWSYRQIAKHGRQAFYEGAIAEKILTTSRELGGTLTADDLAKFSSQWVTPISTKYHRWRVYELPPNGQGIAVLSMLSIMERFPIRAYGAQSADALHIGIEAKKLAYADMLRFVGDPVEQEIPIGELLSRDYTSQRAALIDLTRANCSVQAGNLPRTGSDTTYLCVVDAEGNMVSYIQSIYESFGSGIVPPGTGFALHNRGALFSLDPGSPNVLAGRKRPLHTIIPGFMSAGDLRVAFGIMGGWNQAQAHAQFVSNLVDHDMNIQAALEAPRFTKLTFPGCDVRIESRVPAEVVQNLNSRGHEITVCEPYSDYVGGGQAVMRNFATGVNYGASDPRKDGLAISQPHLMQR